MAKLYFRHGTMGSAKTLNLLAVAHNYQQQGKKVLLIKPEMDYRFGKEQIKSRAGLEKNADLLLRPDSKLHPESFAGVSCALVDEAHFLSPGIIEQFREITIVMDIPIICYGLRTDFKSFLFAGSKRLLELSDSIEEVKATCHFCRRKSIMNLKHLNGKAINYGPSIELGAEEKYFPACYRCYKDALFQKVTVQMSPPFAGEKSR